VSCSFDGAAPGVRIERTFKAPPEEVFDSWTSVEMLKRWWHAKRAWETPLAEVDLRVGGAIRIVMRDPTDGREYGGGGVYTEIDRPRRLAFTWTWDGQTQAPSQSVEVEFTAVEEGTRVALRNYGLPLDERDGYLSGWENSLDNLAVALSS
jgi:uncharacterized protein YndB with AHSA1/START domain